MQPRVMAEERPRAVEPQRMPRVEDFPPVVQAEIEQRKAPAAPQHEERGPMGLLRRITSGLSRREEETARLVPAEPREASMQRTANSAGRCRRKPRCMRQNAAIWTIRAVSPCKSVPPAKMTSWRFRLSCAARPIKSVDIYETLRNPVASGGVFCCVECGESALNVAEKWRRVTPVKKA